MVTSGRLDQPQVTLKRGIHVILKVLPSSEVSACPRIPTSLIILSVPVF